jgi:hypothetical protein
VFDQNTTIATEQMHALAKPRSSINSTSQLFKKQRLRLNPTSMDCNVFTNVKSLGNHDQVLPDADDNASFVFEEDDQSISSHGSVVVNSCRDTSFDGTTKIPTVENDYACFTTSQKCVTSLMHLLDDMECPDYAFQSIMEWARNCFEAGFNFNPRSRTRVANSCKRLLKPCNSLLMKSTTLLMIRCGLQFAHNLLGKNEKNPKTAG